MGTPPMNLAGQHDLAEQRVDHPKCHLLTGREGEGGTAKDEMTPTHLLCALEYPTGDRDVCHTKTLGVATSHRNWRVRWSEQQSLVVRRETCREGTEESGRPGSRGLGPGRRRARDWRAPR